MKYLILGMLFILVIAAACKGAETKPVGQDNTGNTGQVNPGTQPDTEINGTNVDDNSTQEIDENINDAVEEINNW